MPRPNVTTAEELLSLREPGFRHELVRGELRRMSCAGYWHGAVAGRLAALIGTHVLRQRLGMTFGTDTGFLLERNPDTVRAPDLAFVERERVPAQPGPGYFPGPPDFAVEVISPSDELADVHEEAVFWLEHGTRLVWVVDPKANRVTAYRSKNDVRVFAVGDRLEGGDVVPGLCLSVREIFPSLDVG
ncbi:MAG TPA: Uma2 family endonuclease [Planctomycetota bacterium]|nr:Uma2 family endonuclease [Planctomycetota bacterium]